MITHRRVWMRRSTLVATARAANAGFFLLTSLYCLLTYSPFAYKEFVKSHMIAWLADFVAWHHLGFWLVLLITAWTLLPELGRARGRTIALGYLATSALVGTVLLVRPVLPQVENNGVGLALALAALVPPIWLAIFDHYRYQPESSLVGSSSARVLAAALLACFVVWSGQVLLIPWRLSHAGEITLTAQAVTLGILMSAAAHLLVFAIIAWLVLAVLRAARWPPSQSEAEYWLILTMAVAAATLVINRQLLAAIAFAGFAAWVLSIELAVMLVLVWSAIGRLLQAEVGKSSSTVELWLAPIPGIRSRAFSSIALGALVLVQAGLIRYLMTFDWDFLLQKVSILAIWFLAFGYAFGALARLSRALGWASIAAPALAGMLVYTGSLAAYSRWPSWIRDSKFSSELALEGYVAVDLSYRLISDALRVESREDARFYAELRANSVIERAAAPIDVDFVRTLHRVDTPKPNVFLFVIDSLRRDYLSAYNPAVDFSPAIGKFAKDSFVFERAFTRYGGTGLAVPSIWTGGMLLHKMYVTPFNPMNALLKMLDADRYRRVMSMDSIVTQLMDPPPQDDELDRGVPIMDYRLCTTFEELQGKLKPVGTGEARHRERRPVFAYSLPQDLHISHIRSRVIPPGRSYAGFVPQVAAQVEEIDGCFGRFVEFLKENDLYERSVIIITADHGDSLGEGLRWGHSYTMFPEVARIPLIMRVPEAFRRGLTVDPGAVAFSTDLTPTIYALAGHHPADLGPLYGRPLLVEHDRDLSPRRTDPHLITSSYGGVYGVVTDNGSRLYIADGVNQRDYAYELGPQSTKRVGVTVAEREANRSFIRQQIEELARSYGFTPRT